MPDQAPLASLISHDRASTQPGKPLRLPIALIVSALLGVAMLLLGLGRAPALVRHPRSLAPWRSRERLSRAFRVRRAGSVVATVALAPDNDVVRRVDRTVSPGEEFGTSSGAGPLVVDTASAGGVIGVCDAGVVRAALAVLAASERHTVIITADCVRDLYGGNGQPKRVTVARTLDEAIGLVHAESVERIRAEEDGRSDDGAREAWLCARADAQQARLRYLFEGATEHGVHAVLLGHWPFGPSLAVDDRDVLLARPRALPREGVPAETARGAEPVRSEGADERPQLMILGPERIKVDGIELPEALERRFSWEVATYLACHREGATADTIIEELWPGEPLMSARKRFTDAVYHLRKALRTASDQPYGKFVLLRMNRYRLDETQLNVDLWDFESAIFESRAAASERDRLEHLRRAVELYRGEFVNVGDGLWAEPFRHDLRRKVVGALVEAASLLEPDNPSMAITMLEDAGRAMPWAEEADRHIMRIHQRLGRADDARGAYEALKERLRRMGEEPSSKTRELAQAIAAGSPES